MSSKNKNLFAEFQSQWNAFDRYRVSLRLKDLAGGAPKDPKLIDAWLNARNKEMSDQARAELRDATVDELPDVAAGTADKSTVGFKSNGKGLLIEGRQVKAMLKESSNVIKTIAPGGRGKKKDVGEDGVIPEKEGITNLKSKVAERLFIEEDHITLGRDVPDFIDEKPIHVMTAMGPRDSIKRVEVLENVEIEFTLRRHRGNDVPEKTMLAILYYGQTLGLGADRSQGRGRFEVLSVEKLDEQG